VTKPVKDARSAAALDPGEAKYAVAAVAKGCSGHVGLAAWLSCPLPPHDSLPAER
jgi:hypothetical protein